jgi:hypothetical protein
MGGQGQPGSSTTGSDQQDWQQYVSGNQQGTSDSQAKASAGGYFEMEVTGSNLNVTTTFGLGQGRSTNSTNSPGVAEVNGETGGGGGQQTTLTADEGRIFIRGSFLNRLDPNVIPSN